ncbi:unnamed protein product [Soboliphyme baturini]|uniref:Reverse transcriptase domain-containing protein n=1 Tax=Soboliphyme baturini TaxID=241478 RepID=A0A183IUK3_9BILA|nr:unnamed protein product [Soboliphyme baturini]
MEKDDSEHLNVYRPITLVLQIYKVCICIFLKYEEGRFLTGFSTIDHIQIIQHLTEQYTTNIKCHCFASVDRRKAFDSVELIVVANVLHEHVTVPLSINLID